LRVNEVLANEPGSNVDGEAIEIVNHGDVSADLSGYSLSDRLAVRHVFPAGTVLPGHAALVVYGGASAAPAGAMVASTGRLELSNSGDDVVLRDANGISISAVSFGSSPDGVSHTRWPEDVADAPLVPHDQVGAAPASLGTRVSGAAF